jgi:transposase-like protein
MSQTNGDTTPSPSDYPFRVPNRVYTHDERLAAVRTFVESGMTISASAKAQGIARSVLGKWRKNYIGELAATADEAVAEPAVTIARRAIGRPKGSKTKNRRTPQVVFDGRLKLEFEQLVRDKAALLSEVANLQAVLDQRTKLIEELHTRVKQESELRSRLEDDVTNLRAQFDPKLAADDIQNLVHAVSERESRITDLIADKMALTRVLEIYVQRAHPANG